MTQNRWHAEITGPYPSRWAPYRVEFFDGVSPVSTDEWYRTRSKAERKARQQIAYWTAWHEAKANKTVVS